MTTFLASIPSPPQGVWHLGWLPIRAYALFIIVGIIVALVIGDRRWVARGGEPGVIYDIALWAVPFGLIGGRLYHVMTDWRTYFGEEGAGLLAALRIWDGGLGIWGAVALGGVGAWIGCRQRGVPLPAFGDAIAPGIVLAQAIGRLGNYFNQELFGRPTSLPWGLKIYERRDESGALDMLNGVSTGQPADIAPHPVHPTFLYELIWNVLVFLLLIYVDRRFKMGHGRLFASYVAAYCVGRFGVELLRDDTATLIAGVRINLFTSTFVFIGAVVYIVLAPKGREDPATLAGMPREPEEPKPVEAKKKIPAPPEDSALVEWTRELAAVTSTTGVVAGVAVAVEDEDREEAEEEAAEAAATAEGSRDEAAEAEEAEPENEQPDEAELAESAAEPEVDEEVEEEQAEPEPEEAAEAVGDVEAAEAGEPETAEAEADSAEQAEVAVAAVGGSARKSGWLARLRSRRANRSTQRAAAETREVEEPVVAAAGPSEEVASGAVESEVAEARDSELAEESEGAAQAELEESATEHDGEEVAGPQPSEEAAEGVGEEDLEESAAEQEGDEAPEPVATGDADEVGAEIEQAAEEIEAEASPGPEPSEEAAEGAGEEDLEESAAEQEGDEAPEQEGDEAPEPESVESAEEAEVEAEGGEEPEPESVEEAQEAEAEADESEEPTAQPRDVEGEATDAEISPDEFVPDVSEEPAGDAEAPAAGEAGESQPEGPSPEIEASSEPERPEPEIPSAGADAGRRRWRLPRLRRNR